MSTEWMAESPVSQTVGKPTFPHDSQRYQVLIIDVRSSTESEILVTHIHQPLWFTIPIEAIETISPVRIGHMSGRDKIVCEVRFKPGFESLGMARCVIESF